MLFAEVIACLSHEFLGKPELFVNRNRLLRSRCCHCLTECMELMIVPKDVGGAFIKHTSTWLRLWNFYNISALAGLCISQQRMFTQDIIDDPIEVSRLLQRGHSLDRK